MSPKVPQNISKFDLKCVFRFVPQVAAVAVAVAVAIKVEVAVAAGTELSLAYVGNYAEKYGLTSRRQSANVLSKYLQTHARALL